MIGACALAIPFGIVALVQIKSTRQQGKGFAIAGLAASAVWLLGASAGAVTSTIDADRSDLRGTAASVASTTVADRGGPRATVGMTSIDDLGPGDCLTNAPADARVTHVTLAPCNEPHYAEVITEVHLSGPWPGTAQAFQQSERLCMDATMAILTNSTMLDQLRNLVLPGPGPLEPRGHGHLFGNQRLRPTTHHRSTALTEPPITGGRGGQDAPPNLCVGDGR
ncbi:DUF4190 domain-containing protein [Nocardia xishanensis]|uniref:DUF4190 domain-containing protein n=1 Tax=Nocardia xishanensis TaxID=238964 RepID=UPI0008315AB2|nr:DUF4190 domain-containing protein [Nocardia xishanensis]